MQNIHPAIFYTLAIVLIFSFFRLLSNHLIAKAQINYKVSNYSILCVCFFLVFWFYPLISFNLFQKDAPSLPSPMGDFYRTSVLFTRTSPTVAVNYIQIKKFKDDNWRSVPVHTFSKMNPFGFYSRIDHFLYLGLHGGRQRPESHAQRQKLAEWVRSKYSEMFPVEPKLYAVRFIIWKLGKNDPFNQGKKWEFPKPHYFRRQKPYVYSEHVFN